SLAARLASLSGKGGPIIGGVRSLLLVVSAHCTSPRRSRGACASLVLRLVLTHRHTRLTPIPCQVEQQRRDGRIGGRARGRLERRDKQAGLGRLLLHGLHLARVVGATGAAADPRVTMRHGCP